MSTATGTTVFREVSLKYGKRRTSAPITNAGQAARFFRSVIGNDTREHMVAVYLDTQATPLGYAILSIGTVDSTVITAREMFAPALALAATAVVFAHNHPSGNPTPSPEDAEATVKMAMAGQILGIRVVDSLVLGDGKFSSLRQMGVFQAIEAQP